MVSIKNIIYLTIGGRNATDVDLLSWIIQKYPVDRLLWGRSLLDIPLMVVPRAMWPDKPTEIGVRLFQEYSGWEGYQNAWHPGIIGELYVNFHLLGVIAGMLLLGAVCAKLDTRRFRQSGSPLSRIFYAVFAIKFVVMGLVTGFMFPVIHTLLFLIPIYIAGKLVSTNRQTERARPRRSRKYVGSKVLDR